MAKPTARPRSAIRTPAPLPWIVVAALVLAGCSASPDPASSSTPPTPAGAPSENLAAPTPAPSESALQAAYEKAIAEFPFELPEGVDWPEKMPKGSMHGTPGFEGENAARTFWGCSIIHAAWATAERGDTDTADQIIAELRQDTLARNPYLSTWDTVDVVEYGWDPAVRYMGDNFGCIAWFQRNHLPIP